MEIIQNPESEDSARRSALRDILKIFEFTISLELFLGFLLLCLYYEMPVEMSLSPLFVYNIGSMIRLGSAIRRGENYREELIRHNRFFYLCVSVLDGLGKVFLSLYLQIEASIGLSLLCYACPLVLGFVMRKSYPNRFRRLLEFIHSALRVVLVLVLLMMSLRDYFLFDWDWDFVLFPSLTFFSVTSFLSLALFVCICLYLCFTCKCSHNSFNQVDLYILFLLVVYTGSIQYLNSILPKVLESGDWSEMVYPIAVMGVSTLIALISVIAFHRHLLSWVELRFNINNFRIPQEEAEEEPPQSDALRKLPKMFARVSPEFYKPISKREFKQKMTMTNSSAIVHEQKEDQILRSIASHEDVVDTSNIELPSHQISVQNTLCVICCSVPSNAVLFKCGHGSICFDCAQELKKTKKKCHICRSFIIEVQKVTQNFHAAYCNE